LLKVVKKTPFSAPILSLVTFPLAKAPRYDAISYTWNGQDRDQDLCLDNGRLKTTKNVIRIVHKRATFKWTNWLWIDAICINQEHLGEKLGQIRLMGDIYRSASRVLAWLDYEDVSLLDLILMSILNRNLWKQSIMLSVVRRNSEGMDGRILRRMWRARTRLVCQGYWTRCWVIQELALAKQIHIVYGGQMLKWETLKPQIGSRQAIEASVEFTTIAEIEKSNKQDKIQPNLSKEARTCMSSLFTIREFIQEQGPMNLSAALFFYVRIRIINALR